MTKEFLESLGIADEAAQAVLEECRKEREESEKMLDEEKARGNKLAMDYEIDGLMRDFGARNLKAVKALLDIAAAEESEDFSLSLKNQLEKLKEENGYLFGSDKAPKIVGKSGKSNSDGFGFRFTGVR